MLFGLSAALAVTGCGPYEGPKGGSFAAPFGFLNMGGRPIKLPGFGNCFSAGVCAWMRLGCLTISILLESEVPVEFMLCYFKLVLLKLLGTCSMGELTLEKPNDWTSTV